MFNNLFENIGEKIKNTVKFFAIFGMVISILLGVDIIFEGFIFIGIIVTLLGFLISWMGSWLLYGYGELIQRCINIDKKLSGTHNDATATTAPQQPKPAYVKPATTSNNEFNHPTSEQDKEVLYQFALEKIKDKQYKFAYNALKRIRGYKDSEALIERIDNIDLGV